MRNNIKLKNVLIWAVMCLTLSCAKVDYYIVFDGPSTIDYKAQTVVSNAREDIDRKHSKEFTIDYVVCNIDGESTILEYDSDNDCYAGEWVTVRKKGNGLVFEFTENTLPKERIVDVSISSENYSPGGKCVTQLPKE